MAIKSHSTTFFLFFFFSFLLLAILPTPGTGIAKDILVINPSNTYLQSKGWKREGFWRWREKGAARRLMIGSIAPICTYNECRGCRSKCRAEQVPVDANDPVNSEYRYRCVCHR